MVFTGFFRKLDTDKQNRLASVIISTEKTLVPEALQDLCASVGWARRDPDLINRALANSLAVVSAWDGDLLVGFARATGDKVFNATIWDVAVRPSYQRLGLGKRIMREIINQLDEYPISLITLYADPGRDGFYKRLGFNSDPSGIRAMFRERS